MTKQHSEQRIETAVGFLLKTLEQNVADTGTILDEFEDSHDDRECEQSKHYATLVAIHYSLKDIIERITKKLNKKD